MDVITGSRKKSALPGEGIERALRMVATATTIDAGDERAEPHRVDLRLPRSTRDRLVEDYLAGIVSRVLATKYGISTTKVIELIREAGHEPRVRGPGTGTGTTHGRRRFIRLVKIRAGRLARNDLPLR